jgi:choline dehydrogenase-like flavoprotein
MARRRQGLMGGNVFMPRFRNLKKDEKRDFIKGYCMLVSSGGSAQPFTSRCMARNCRRRSIIMPARACGQHFRRATGALRESRHIDKEVVDAWGIPVLHVDVKDGDNEHNMAKDAANTMEEIFTAAKWDIVSKTDKFFPPGYSIHEVGTARMGDDPQEERAEQVEPDARYQESAGGGRRGFVTCGWQNPTMTILALSMRASEHLAEEMKKGNV